jgi:hypothetical protein
VRDKKVENEISPSKGADEMLEVAINECGQL